MRFRVEITNSVAMPEVGTPEYAELARQFLEEEYDWDGDPGPDEPTG